MFPHFTNLENGDLKRLNAKNMVLTFKIIISLSTEISELNLRVFLGEEYECPRGHRFFCSGPEKIIKVSSTSTVKVGVDGF